MVRSSAPIVAHALRSERASTVSLAEVDSKRQRWWLSLRFRSTRLALSGCLSVAFWETPCSAPDAWNERARQGKLLITTGFMHL